MQCERETSESLEFVTYRDANLTTDKEYWKSATGGFVTVGRMAVGWVYRKQGGVLLSTMVVEYRTASVMGQKLLGIPGMLGEFRGTFMEPMALRVDNQPALKQLDGEKASSKAKHIDIRIKFVVHYTTCGVLKPDYCESKYMPAAVLTKALAAPRLSKLQVLVGLQ
ncbi:hypothetical protein PC121_g15390 [Phytophthora cactorum]|nr:hypothetical protein PC120_g14172 [Phytophthora cactorum]KAG3056237.1 hypothetical protein PC121_g15390 [Phytophthora cactorum]